MKRFILFGFDECYPKGGMTDFINSFDAFDEALNFVKLDLFEYDIFQIYDLEYKKILLQEQTSEIDNLKVNILIFGKKK